MQELQLQQSSELSNQSFSFKNTTATEKIFGLRKRIRAVAGGTSASKTVSILVWLIDYCQGFVGSKKCDIVSESYPHLQDGAISDFKSIMRDRGYWNDRNWNDTKHTYTFETGNVMHFYSVDTYGKAHGPRRDVLFINEANNMNYLIVDQLITRTREVVWLDWNPSEEFWFYTEMMPNRDDIDFITLTYKDNEALDEITIAEIESHKNNKMWWQVYGLGQLGEIASRVYTGWNFIDEIPFEARLMGYGLDFGYKNDPTAIVAVYEHNGGYILDERCYAQRMGNDAIGDVLINMEKGLVIADSAEPKSIDQIREYTKSSGVTILPAEKGKDSVKHGIAFIQEQKISVTRRSLNIIKEYRNYLYITDKDGKILNEPIDDFNHAMDAFRYRISSKMKKVVWKPKPVGGVKPYLPGMLA